MTKSKTFQKKPETIHVTNYNIVYNYPSCNCDPPKKQKSKGGGEWKNPFQKKNKEIIVSNRSKPSKQKETSSSSGGGVEGDDFSTHIYPHIHNVYQPCNKGRTRNSFQSD